MDENLETRVARQFSSLYLTLVSVMVGLVLADLFSAVHARMTLWPLNLETLRTWCQIAGDSICALGGWVVYSHMGLLRRRLPTIWDTLDAVLVLVVIPMNAAVGRHDPTAWFFWSAGYCLFGSCAVHINLWQSAREPALAHMKRLGRFGGPYTGLYLGVPSYLGMAAASYLHLTTPPVDFVAAALGPCTALTVTISFMRAWRAAVLLQPPKTKPVPRQVGPAVAIAPSSGRRRPG